MTSIICWERNVLNKKCAQLNLKNILFHIFFQEIKCFKSIARKRSFFVFFTCEWNRKWKKKRTFLAVDFNRLILNKNCKK